MFSKGFFFKVVENLGLCGEDLTPVFNKLFENTMEKGEIAHNEQFLLFPQCFQRT